MKKILIMLFFVLLGISGFILYEKYLYGYIDSINGILVIIVMLFFVYYLQMELEKKRR